MDLNVAELVKALWPLIALQFIVAVWALLDLARRKTVRWIPKWLWALIILANLLGAIFYLAAGRKE